MRMVMQCMGVQFQLLFFLKLFITLRTLLFACTNFSVLVSPCIWRGLILAVLWVQILNEKLIKFTHEEHASNLLKGVLRWQYSSSIK